MAEKDKTASFRMMEENFKELKRQLEEHDMLMSDWGRRSAWAYSRNPEAYKSMLNLLEEEDISPEDIGTEGFDPTRARVDNQFGLEPEMYNNLIEHIGDYFDTLLDDREESYEEAMEIGQEIYDFNQELGELVAHATVYLEEIYQEQ